MSTITKYFVMLNRAITIGTVYLQDKLTLITPNNIVSLFSTLFKVSNVIYLTYKWSNIEISKEMYVFAQAQVLTLFRMEVAKKALTTNFSPATSTNVGISSKTFWLLVSTPLSHLCKISRPYLVPVSNYWIWNKSSP